MIRKMTDFNAILWGAYLKRGMCVLDATLGNGHDAVMIKSYIGDEGHLYGFDVQERALSISAEKLKAFQNVSLFLASHDTVDQQIPKDVLDAAIYNLGFLPGGDKTQTTQCMSSLLSIQKVLYLLKVGGVLSVTFYPGHHEGKQEAEVITAYLKSLDAKRYHVMSNCYTNQSEEAPFTIWVEKK